MTSKEKTYLGVGLAGAAALATLVVIAKAKAKAPPKPPSRVDAAAKAILAAARNAGLFLNPMNPITLITRFYPAIAPYYPGVEDIPALVTAIVTQAVAMGGNVAVDTAGNVVIEFGKGVLKNPLSSLVGWTMVLGALGATAWFFAPAVREKSSSYRRLGAPQPAGWPR